MLVGPGFLQLVLAKHLKRAGLKPIIVAPQKKLDSFFANLVLDNDLKEDATIGLPETGDPYFGELKGVVFCAEDAILPSEFVTRVLDFTHEGKSVWADGAPARAICALPVSDKVQKEKSNSWIPIFNNDRTIEQTWRNFEEKFKGHAVFKSEGGVGSIIRFGSLFGGSSDGPPFLKEENLALEEGMYKVRIGNCVCCNQRLESLPTFFNLTHHHRRRRRHLGRCLWSNTEICENEALIVIDWGPKSWRGMPSIPNHQIRKRWKRKV